MPVLILSMVSGCSYQLGNGRCRKLMLARNNGGVCRCLTSCYDFELTFHFFGEILISKGLSWLHLKKTVRCRL